MACSGNTLFGIYSKAGKEIESIAEFDMHSLQNKKKEFLNSTQDKLTLIDFIDKLNLQKE